jgi:hypothetical protein
MGNKKKPSRSSSSFFDRWLFFLNTLYFLCEPYDFVKHYFSINFYF